MGDRRRRDQDARRRARPARAGALHLGHGGPSNEDAVGAQAAVQALLDAAERGARAGRHRGRRQLGAAVLAVAGTDTDSVDPPRARGPTRGLDRRQRRRRRVGHRDRAPARASAAISGTGSNVFGVGARRARAGGRAAGVTCSATRARATGWASESIKAALRDRDGSGPPTALSDGAPAFFGVASVEALASLRLLQAADQGRDRGLRDRDRQARRARGRGRAASCTSAARASSAGRSRRSSARPAWLTRARFPVGLIGSAFKAGEVFVAAAHPADPRVRARRARRASSRWPPSAAACCWPRARAAGGEDLRGASSRACSTRRSPAELALAGDRRGSPAGPRSPPAPPIAAGARARASARLRRRWRSRAACSGERPSASATKKARGEHVAGAEVVVEPLDRARRPARAAPPPGEQDRVRPGPVGDRDDRTAPPRACSISPAQLARSCSLTHERVAALGRERRLRDGRARSAISPPGADPSADEPLRGQPDEARCARPAAPGLAGDGREVQDRGVSASRSRRSGRPTRAPAGGAPRPCRRSAASSSARAGWTSSSSSPR